MLANITWLHLSDWHQGGGDFDRSVVAGALLEDIEKRGDISPELADINFVFFTGDLAFGGKKEEYEAAWKLLLEPVLTTLDLRPDRLFLIPGNHDLDRDEFDLLPAGLLQPFQTKQLVDKWLTGKGQRAALLNPFCAYQQFVTDLKVQGFGSFGDSRIIPIRGKQIGVVGFNSALMCGRNKDAAGKIYDYGFLTTGEPQIFNPLREIANADVKIALIHHPFDWLQEDDRRIVRARLQTDSDFILRGHEHEQAVQITKGTHGDCVIIPGGACYNGRIPDRPAYINAYNFVSYDTETGKGTVFLRRWNLNDTGWTADTDRGDREGKYAFHFPRPEQPPPNPQ